MCKNKRIDYIDILKGIAIFLVIWGHVIQNGGMKRNFFEDKMFIFIYSFHMPLFMMLSGFVFSKNIVKKTFYEHIKSKMLRLAMPAIVWGALFYIVKFIVENYLLKNTFLFNLQEFFRAIWNIWFLWSLFFCTIIVLIAEQMKDKYMHTIILLLGCVILYLLPNGDLNVFMFPYFLVGFLWGKKEDIAVKYYCLCLVLFPIMLSYYSREHFIYVSGILKKYQEIGSGGQAVINIFRWGIGFTGSISIIAITKWLIKDLSEDNILRKIFCDLGKYTLEIYVMQRIVVEYLGAKVMWKIVNEKGLEVLNNAIIYDYIYTFLGTVIFLFILFYLAVWYQKCMNRLKIKLGKKW